MSLLEPINSFKALPDIVIRWHLYRSTHDNAGFCKSSRSMDHAKIKIRKYPPYFSDSS